MAEANSKRRSPGFKDLTGKPFGKWTVIGEAPKRYNRVYWTCRCECGTISDVSGKDLRKKRSSCCKNCRSVKHGHNQSPTYRSWSHMLSRCRDTGNDSYHRYGARGIAVCARWHSFESFLEDMGVRPSNSRSIERIDNHGNYSCGHCDECVQNSWTANCRWATRPEQQRNMRTNRMVTYKGETMCVAAWAERVGMSAITLWSRLFTLKWSVERALTTPVKQSKAQKQA